MDCTETAGQKSAFLLFLKLINTWYGDGRPIEIAGVKKGTASVAAASKRTIARPPIPDAVTQYVFENITRACLELPLLPEFQFDTLGLATSTTREDCNTTGDAACHVIVGEIATIQKTMAVRLGDAYGNFLINQNVWVHIAADAVERWPSRKNQTSQLVGALKAQSTLGQLNFAALSGEYAVSLRELDLKTFKTHFKQLVKRIRVELFEVV